MLTETLSVRGEHRSDVELDGVNGMRDPPASQELKWGASASGGGDVTVLRCACHHPRLLRTKKGDRVAPVDIERDPRSQQGDVNYQKWGKLKHSILFLGKIGKCHILLSHCKFGIRI